MAINSTFYYVEDLMLSRCGKKGYSFEYSLGRAMDKFFYFTHSSLCIYRKLGGALTQFLFVIIIWISYIPIIHSNLIGNDIFYSYVILILSLFSTVYYHQIFDAQNYNVVGWAFFPFFIYSVITNYWIGAAILLLIISFGSFTATIIGFFICLTISIVTLSLTPLIVAIPAGIKLVSHFWRLISELPNELSMIFEVLGFSRKGKKKRILKFNIFNFYYLTIVAFYSLTFFYLSGWNSEIGMILSSLLLLIFSLYIINNGFARFADPQSLYMVSFILFTLSAFYANSLYIILPYLIAVNIHPLVLTFAGEEPRNCLYSVPRRAAYTINPLLSIIDNFFSPIPEKSRVIELHEFNDDDYSSVFKDLRPIHEIILYSANLKYINLVPDFVAIFDSWGMGFPLSKILKQNPKDAINACITLGSPYIMILVENSEYDEKEWIQEGFCEISRLNWNSLRPFLEDSNVLKPGDYSYRILILKTHVPTIIEGGKIISISPNSINIKITSSNNFAVIKYLYDAGWKSPEKDVLVKKHSGEWPWIEVHAPEGRVVMLSYS